MPPALGAEEIGRPAGGEPLRLEQVVESVQRAYPELQIAFQERQVADGKQLSAQGAFDLQAKAFSIAQPLGYYDNYQYGLGLTQPTYGGGYLYSGYKLGRGSFEPWFKERQTNDGGEFALGLGAPLLKNREIDQRRADLFDAQLARRAVEPAAQAQLLDLVRQATQSYWIWVASGLALDAHQRLLDLAQQRVGQIEIRVERGDLPEIARINNEQLIASRETKVIDARRKLQMSAIKLSLFWRSPSAEPIVPEPTALPAGFPEADPPNADQLNRDIATAVARRPEVVELDLMAERVRVQLNKARNDLLPKLDVVLEASKDVGARATSKGDKTPFELEAGLLGEVPLQRREAQGKIESARGKLAQLQSKRQFAVDKITAQVRDSVSALVAAHGAIQRARTTLELAQRTLTLARVQFEAGDIDLVDLNIYEQAVMDARLQLISSQASYFLAQADYRAALAGGQFAGGQGAGGQGAGGQGAGGVGAGGP